MKKVAKTCIVLFSLSILLTGCREEKSTGRRILLSSQGCRMPPPGPECEAREADLRAADVPAAAAAGRQICPAGRTTCPGQAGRNGSCSGCNRSSATWLKEASARSVVCKPQPIRAKPAPEPPKPPKSKRQRAADNWAILVCALPAALPARVRVRQRLCTCACDSARQPRTARGQHFLTGVARARRMQLSRNPDSLRKARNSEQRAWNACTRYDASAPNGSCLAELYSKIVSAVPPGCCGAPAVGPTCGATDAAVS